jgi:hypothetical protein
VLATTAAHDGVHADLSLARNGTPQSSHALRERPLPKRTSCEHA